VDACKWRFIHRYFEMNGVKCLRSCCRSVAVCFQPLRGRIADTGASVTAWHGLVAAQPHRRRSAPEMASKDGPNWRIPDSWHACRNSSQTPVLPYEAVAPNADSKTHYDMTKEIDMNKQDKQFNVALAVSVVLSGLIAILAVSVTEARIDQRYAGVAAHSQVA
jgi:hypothetical protein